MHQQPGRRRLAAAGLADDAEGFARLHIEGHVVDGLHDGLGPVEQPALEREMLGQVLVSSGRLAIGLRRYLAPAPGHERRRMLRLAAHSRTSMAWRRPSLIRLKHIEVMKIMTPGSAATSGVDP